MAPCNNNSRGGSNEKERHVGGCELFVGGLARDVTEMMIREMFSPYGEIVELRMMRDQSGISKGFCFVRFGTKEAAVKAQKEKNGMMFHGKTIGVETSSEQHSLFFGNLQKDWSSEEFKRLVHEAFKGVVSVDLAMPSSTRDSSGGKKLLNRGFAFVQFSSHAVSLQYHDEAARAYRIGSKPDFLLGGDWHPVITWAEKEPEIEPEKLTKIKVAFVGNLPKNADEEFLKELFVPLAKVERVALSRRGHFPVGFVHFATRKDLDNAIRVMDGMTVQGPQKGPDFKIQVSVAKPMEYDRKRAHDEAATKPRKSSGGPDSSYNDRARDSQDRKLKAPRLENIPVDTDPYEAAVIALTSAVKERLLRILRLGIATRYDVDIHCISSLNELPESAAIAVLDQFLISAADKRDKRAHFTSLVARHQVDKLNLKYTAPYFPNMVNNYASKESELLGFRARLVQARDHSASRYSSRTLSESSYSYSSSLTDNSLLSRSGLGKPGETAPLYRGSFEYGSGNGSISHFALSAEHPQEHPQILSQLGLGKPGETSSLHRGSFEYVGSKGSGSRFPLSPEGPHERPQIKFDPFTGQPYKFDPFTGKPIQPETYPRQSGSHF